MDCSNITDSSQSEVPSVQILRARRRRGRRLQHGWADAVGCRVFSQPRDRWLGAFLVLVMAGECRAVKRSRHSNRSRILLAIELHQRSGLHVGDFDWSAWMPVIVNTLITAGIGVAGLVMQQKQIVLAKAQFEASAKKAKVPLKPRWWNLYWPIALMVVLAAVSWIPYILGIDGPVRVPSALVRWGLAPVPGMNEDVGIPVDDPIVHGRVVANGHALRKYAKADRIAAVAFHAIGSIDPFDVSTLQKSALYDIRDEEMEVAIPLDSAFRDDYKHGFRGTNYMLLLVPRGTTMADFGTIHQAQALGVKVLGTGLGPP
jgi:hypothetical protein